MLKKTLETLKRNPVLIIMYVVLMAFSGLLLLLMLPDLSRVMEFSGEISRNPSDPSAADLQEVTEMLLIIIKMLLYGVAAMAFGIVFLAGAGSILSDAVSGGHASFRGFFSGIRRFFVKTLLAFLLLLAFSFGYGVIIGIISIPFSMISMFQSMGGIPDYESFYNSQRIIQILSTIIMVFIYPFIVLWLPALYIEKKDGVITCLKKGFKAGIRNYKLLVVLAAVLLLPSAALMAFNKDYVNVTFTSPVYILQVIYQLVITPVFAVYIFILYSELRKMFPNNDRNMEIR